ncbi:hypothetical protein OESDEN_14991 [Oesophagostomum dentatum]|uniref:Uncharacterized protein n=1 Tax=Oesophagostomum dentatum TaxID=61180 RepID=A0A0B1SN26_OESDE|nr:hypothetical protein OESDEN_14991 [Oesophagostomum dentatum]
MRRGRNAADYGQRRYGGTSRAIRGTKIRLTCAENRSRHQDVFAERYFEKLEEQRRLFGTGTDSDQ